MQKTSRTVGRLGLSLGAIAILATPLACASRHKAGPLVVPDIPAVTRSHATSLPMEAGDGSGPVDWTMLVTRAARADVVLIGETHSHELGLAMAAELFRQTIDAVEAADLDASPALALEFFERDKQVAVDDYMAGISDEPEFITASERSAGNYPPGHRAMVEIARATGAPVYAANAPRRYVRLARTDGLTRLDDLTPTQQALVANPVDLTTGQYRDDFFEVMGGMSHGDDTPALTEEQIESFFISQNVWDATMADTIVRALRDGHTPVFLVVGRFHTDFAGGTKQRILDAMPDAKILSISVLDVTSDSLREEDEGRADVVVYAGGGASEQ